LNNNLDLKYII